MSYLPFSIQRGVGNVIVYLRKKEAPPPLPYELQGVVSQDLWASRVDAASQLCNKWAKPIWERIYFFFALFVQFVVPMAITRFVLVKMIPKDEEDEDRFDSDRYIQYRAISFGLYVGMGMLLWTPLIAWKLIGARKVSLMVREWRTLDQATSQGQYLPKWTIRKPGIFTSNASVTVSLPPMPTVISNFHPDASLPPYINPAPGQPGYGVSDEKAGFQTIRV